VYGTIKKCPNSADIWGEDPPDLEDGFFRIYPDICETIVYANRDDDSGS
jgi:hypothetical protein